MVACGRMLFSISWMLRGLPIMAARLSRCCVPPTVHCLMETVPILLPYDRFIVIGATFQNRRQVSVRAASKTAFPLVSCSF